MNNERIEFLNDLNERMADYALSYPLTSQEGRPEKSESEDKNTNTTRTPFQKDLDILEHSVRYKILDKKGQVLPGNLNPFLMNRLTHTNQVESMSSSVGKRYNLNADQIKSVATGHDLSHALFGHPAQDVFEEMTEGISDYNFIVDHNRQNVRYCLKLADHPKHYQSINVTHTLTNDLDKHHGKISLESAVVNACDPGTYRGHDLGEALSIISVKHKKPILLREDLSHLKIISQIDPEAPNLESAVKDWFRTRLEKAMDNKIHLIEGQPFNKVMELSREVASLDEKDQITFDELGDFLYDEYYYHPEIKQAKLWAQDIIRALFLHFEKKPSKEMKVISKRDPAAHPRQVIVDFLTNVTDSDGILIGKTIGCTAANKLEEYLLKQKQAQTEVGLGKI
jgi:dGTPase